MKKRLTVLFAALTLLALTACRSRPEPQIFSLTLDSNPTTGYSWQVEQAEELFDVDIEYVQDPAPEGATGVGGKETVTLTPKKAGTTDVTLTYARPWEGGETADQMVYTLKVDRNLQVTVENSVTYGKDEPLDSPEPVIEAQGEEQ